MKVAMLTTTGPSCGIAAYTKELITALRDLVEVNVAPITVGRQPVEHYRAQAEQLNRADVVHVQHEHSFWGGILPGHSAYWELRYLIKKPLVITAHTTSSLAEMFKINTERRPHKWLVKRLLLLNKSYRDSIEAAPFVTGWCIVHTEAACRTLIARGANPQYVTVIPAGVPTVYRCEDGGSAIRQKFGLTGRIVTLFGFIAPNKGYELMLAILPNLPPDVRLVFAGGARTEEMKSYERALSEKIRQSGLIDRVLITGYLSDEELAGLMEISHVVAAPHTYATGSYSITIPLAYGKPIVASDLDCFREIYEAVPCLDIFHNGDATDLLTKLNGLLSDSHHREELSQKALEYARERSWPAIAQKTLRVYERAIAAARFRDLSIERR